MIGAWRRRTESICRMIRGSSCKSVGAKVRRRRLQVGRFEASMLLLGLASLIGGIGLWMGGAATQSAPAYTVGRNQLIDREASEVGDISANNSPTAIRNPTDANNLVVANRVDQPRFSCAVHASFDGGQTWHDIQVPLPAGKEEFARCYAPDVAYGPDGALFLSYVTLQGIGNLPNALWVASSSDGGHTFGAPARAGGPLTFQAHLTADPVERARLNLTWLQVSATGALGFPGTGNPILMSSSVDRGATWSNPVRVSPESRARVVAPSPAAGLDGEVYVLYLDLLDDRLDYAGAHEGLGGTPYPGPWALVLARSADRGATWQERVVADIVPTQRFVVFLPPLPSLAIDPTNGRIYVTFADGRLGDADVQMWASEDGGRNFGPPARVNDTAESDGTSQYLPWVGVAPGGRVDVVYLDRRADVMDTFNEVSLQSSFDHGRTFTRRLALTDRPFDSRIGPGGDRALPDLGSRLALVSSRSLVLAVWSDTRRGTEATEKQDLVRASANVSGRGRSRLDWLDGLGAAVSLAGLASLRMLQSGDSLPRVLESRASRALE